MRGSMAKETDGRSDPPASSPLRYRHVNMTYETTICDQAIL